MNRATRRRGIILLSSLLLFGLLASGLDADQGDPPARVARLSIAEGKVTFQPSGETEWSEATVNRPVTVGDRLFADQGARAELEIGNVAVHLSQNTDVTMANLNDQLVQLGVGQGSLRVTLYNLPDKTSVEIDTPNGALVLQAAGSYRVDTAPDGNSTQVTVNVGSLQISAGDLTKTLQAGQAVTLTGTGPVTAAEASVPPPDDFDKWCAGRDKRVEVSVSVKKVGPAVPGGEDLDAYGTWSERPPYGPVWVPAGVPPDWVPYRQGHWVFVEPWGWTWVEDEPWGYAPFHYGRWVHIGPLWAWAPGPVVVQPVYAPALVAFVGGPGFGVGVQAWFPLGPREPYNPWYHYGPGYLHAFNGPGEPHFEGYHYANREVGFTAVSGEVFRGGQPVARGMVRIPPEQMSHAGVIPHPEINPTSRAVFGARAVAAPPVHNARLGAPGPGTAPHAASYGTPHGAASGPAEGTFTPRTPTPATREASRSGPPATPFPHMFTRNAPAPNNAPFAARQDAYSSHPGRPLEPQQMNNLRAGKPAGPMKDKESLPHASAQHTGSKPSSSSSSSSHGDGKKH